MKGGVAKSAAAAASRGFAGGLEAERRAVATPRHVAPPNPAAAETSSDDGREGNGNGWRTLFADDSADDSPAQLLAAGMRAGELMLTPRALAVPKPGGSSAPAALPGATSAPSSPGDDVAGGGEASRGTCAPGMLPAIPGRRCGYCNALNTPLWRNGPFGPKTLCNACGVRDNRQRGRLAAARHALRKPSSGGSGSGGGGGGGAAPVPRAPAAPRVASAPRPPKALLPPPAAAGFGRPALSAAAAAAAHAARAASPAWSGEVPRRSRDARARPPHVIAAAAAAAAAAEAACADGAGIPTPAFSVVPYYDDLYPARFVQPAGMLRAPRGAARLWGPGSAAPLYCADAEASRWLAAANAARGGSRHAACTPLLSARQFERLVDLFELGAWELARPLTAAEAAAFVAAHGCGSPADAEAAAAAAAAGLPPPSFARRLGAPLLPALALLGTGGGGGGMDDADAPTPAAAAAARARLNRQASDAAAVAALAAAEAAAVAARDMPLLRFSVAAPASAALPSADAAGAPPSDAAVLAAHAFWARRRGTAPLGLLGSRFALPPRALRDRPELADGDEQAEHPFVFNAAAVERQRRQEAAAAARRRANEAAAAAAPAGASRKRSANDGEGDGEDESEAGASDEDDDVVAHTGGRGFGSPGARRGGLRCAHSFVAAEAEAPAAKKARVTRATA